jgi:hypothetical protein
MGAFGLQASFDLPDQAGALVEIALFRNLTALKSLVQQGDLFERILEFGFFSNFDIFRIIVLIRFVPPPYADPYQSQSQHEATDADAKVRGL